MLQVSLSLYIYNYTRLDKYVVSHCIMTTTMSLSQPFIYYMSNCSQLSTVQASAPSCNAQHLCSQKLRTSVGQSIYQALSRSIKQYYPYGLSQLVQTWRCPISGHFFLMGFGQFTVVDGADTWAIIGTSALPFSSRGCLAVLRNSPNQK